MRYLIDESINGKYMVRYTKEFSEVEMETEESKEIIEILRVWQPTNLSHVRNEDIEDEFGVSLSDLKSIIANCFAKANMPTDEWIQVDILNIM